MDDCRESIARQRAESTHRAKRTLQTGRDFYDRAVHECRTRLVFPCLLRFVNNRLIPEEFILQAASELQLARHLTPQVNAVRSRREQRRKDGVVIHSTTDRPPGSGEGFR